MIGAELLFRLHAEPGPLVLVNAWDAGSARVLEHAGARAIATSAAGMAWSLGYATAGEIPEAEFLAACGRICRAVGVPVSVDIGGRPVSSVQLCGLVRSLLAAGVAGFDLAESVPAHSDTPGLCEQLRAVRSLLGEAKAGAFLNARVDAGGVGSNRERYQALVQCALACVAAGADGLVVVGLEPMALANFTDAVPAPVTIEVDNAWGASVRGLALGGARGVALGSGPIRSALGVLHRLAVEAFRHGTYRAMASPTFTPGQVEDLYRRVSLR